ncbi:hypothetical protein F2Q70_00028750 [Brassica cretica]|uniref:MATH domain-containing protein n=1 Tax=Brassica cretica TaxID=69181 RepID=A0A8S9L4D5_BRACR|nr:hypothetical protein F2Q70_00028750 [Brassica cretica]
MWNQKPSFRIAIDNFSEKKYPMPSKTFVAGGCEWFLSVYPNGDPFSDHDHFSMYLHVANQTMLRPGWKRNVLESTMDELEDHWRDFESKE